MKIIPYHLSAKLRQFNTLSQRLNKQIQNGSFYLLSVKKRNMLIGRLKRLHNQLLVFVPEFKLKQILATAAALVFTVSAGSVRAQTFAVKQSSPFGISSSGIITFPNFVDLDNDGDPDLFIGEYNRWCEYFPLKY